MEYFDADIALMFLPTTRRAADKLCSPCAKLPGMRSDPVHLRRFADVQPDGVNERALDFPQLAGRGRRSLADYRGITGAAEARAHSPKPVLSPQPLACRVAPTLEQPGR